MSALEYKINHIDSRLDETGGIEHKIRLPEQCFKAVGTQLSKEGANVARQDIG